MKPDWNRGRKYAARERHEGARQGGFTLIELMIVVTIIGILASIAVPAYRDYTIRAKLSEAMNIFGSVKTAYSVYYYSEASLPDELTDLPEFRGAPPDNDSDYIGLVGIEANGNVRFRTRDTRRLGDAADKFLEFRPDVSTSDGVINWLVYTDTSQPDWVPQKYLPNF